MAAKMKPLHIQAKLLWKSRIMSYLMDSDYTYKGEYKVRKIAEECLVFYWLSWCIYCWIDCHGHHIDQYWWNSIDQQSLPNRHLFKCYHINFWLMIVNDFLSSNVLSLIKNEMWNPEKNPDSISMGFIQIHSTEISDRSFDSLCI